MVRDGSSGRDDGLGGELGGGGAGPDQQFPNAPHDVPNQLTQELARLLAASIAQSQGGKGFPLGVPTGSDLASLASLVSAASGQRNLAPVFKDGLSALSYGPPHARPAPILAPAPPEPPPDDEPMPIPSTWREPGSYDDDRWFRQQLGATLLGLFAGLLIVVPAVLWLTGWIGPQRPRPAASATGVTKTASAVVARPAEGRVEAAASSSSRPSEATASQYVTGSVEPRGMIEIRKPEPAAPAPPVVPTAAPQPPFPPPAPKVEEQRARLEELVAKARQKIDAGDVMGAREILAMAEASAPGGTVTYALAETYDPERLAAWGTRGVAADATKARSLYTKALGMGLSRAQERLDALK
jgi:hypothetical protein